MTYRYVVYFINFDEVRQTSLDLVTDLLKRTDEINDWETIESIIIQGIGDAVSWLFKTYIKFFTCF